MADFRISTTVVRQAVNLNYPRSNRGSGASIIKPPEQGGFCFGISIKIILLLQKVYIEDMNYLDWVDAVVTGLLDEAIRGDAHELPTEERTQWAGNRGLVTGASEEMVREDVRSEMGSKFDPSSTFWMALPSMSGKSDQSRLKDHPDQRNTGAHLAHTRGEGANAEIGSHGVRLFISPRQAKGQIGQGRIVPVHLAKGADLHVGNVVDEPGESYSTMTGLMSSVAKLGNPDLTREHGLAGQRLASPYSSLIQPKDVEGGRLSLSSSELTAAGAHLSGAHKDWLNRADLITRQRVLGSAGRTFAKHIGRLGYGGTVHAEPFGERYHVGDRFTAAGTKQELHAPVHTVSLQNRVHIAGDPITKESEAY